MAIFEECNLSAFCRERRDLGKRKNGCYCLFARESHKGTPGRFQKGFGKKLEMQAKI